MLIKLWVLIDFFPILVRSMLIQFFLSHLAMPEHVVTCHLETCSTDGSRNLSPDGSQIAVVQFALFREFQQDFELCEERDNGIS